MENVGNIGIMAYQKNYNWNNQNDYLSYEEVVLFVVLVVVLFVVVVDVVVLFVVVVVLVVVVLVVVVPSVKVELGFVIESGKAKGGRELK